MVAVKVREMKEIGNERVSQNPQATGAGRHDEWEIDRKLVMKERTIRIPEGEGMEEDQTIEVGLGKIPRFKD